MDREQEIAWLAGFIDGEGSFFVTRTHSRGYLSYRPCMAVSNTYIPVMAYINDLLKDYGAISRSRTKNRTSTGRKELEEVSVRSWSGCAKACALLLPYLKVKQMQAAILYEWCCFRTALMTGPAGRVGNPFQDCEHVWYDQLKALNRRGVMPCPTLSI